MKKVSHLSTVCDNNKTNQSFLKKFDPVYNSGLTKNCLYYLLVHLFKNIQDNWIIEALF